MTTNTSNDFYVFMKYSQNPKDTNIVYKSWTFSLTENDKKSLEKYHSLQCPVYLFFICADSDTIESDNLGEIAIYRYEDYLFIKDKSSITINIKKSSDRFFNLHISKSNEKVIRSRRTIIFGWAVYPASQVLLRVCREPFPTSKIIMLITILFSLYL